MLTSLPSLTVSYLPDQGAVELISDCGLEGTRRIACKGQAVSWIGDSITPICMSERICKTICMQTICMSERNVNIRMNGQFQKTIDDTI